MRRTPLLLATLWLTLMAQGAVDHVRPPIAPTYTFFAQPGGDRHDVWFPQLDMATTVHPTSMVVRGPIDAPVWETETSFLGVRRTNGERRAWMPECNTGTDASLIWHGPQVDVEYVITEDGLRQNFLLRSRPPGDGPLSIDLGISSSLCPEEEGTTGIVFRDHLGNARLAYRGLAVWDACGTPVNASIELLPSGHGAVITVYDADAVYPVTVDPVSTTVDRVLNAPVAGTFGWSVANAGDLNGDGYSDVVVGAYTAPGGGRAYVYYGSATGIPAAPSVTLTSGRPDSNYGYSVDGAGDVNNDGYSDLIVGASIWDDNAATPQEGAAFIYHGSATGLNTVPAVILQSNTSANFMGYSVAGLGDINGDGYSDVGTGGYLAGYGQVNEGVAWIFLGSATGVNPVFRHRLERNQGAAQFGSAIAPAGDVNGDGFSDVIVGAYKFELTPGCPTINTCDDGAVFIYHGSANALGVGANPNPTTTFNTVGYSIRTAWSVSNAGDVNGDGYSDIIIGDWRDQIGAETYEGAAFVFHGSATGIVTTPATIIQSNQVDAWMGRSVSSAGDVNGDGYADVIIGCVQWTNGQSKEGAAFLHLGSATGISSSPFLRYESNQINAYMGESVSTAGDVNGDGFSDMIVGIYGLTGGGGAHIYHGGPYNVSTTPSLSRASGLSAARLGAAVANAGDINGDGYSDAIFGAPDATNGQANEGQAYIHYGSINGLVAAPSLILEANVAGAAYGTSVATAGDVNGDGYADVIIGAPLSNGTGRAYLHLGGPAGLTAAPAVVLNGTPGSLFGGSVFTAGDMNADGYADVIIGAPGANMVYVYEGSAAGLVTTPLVVLNAPVANSAFGSAVGTAGDVNGDGFSDMIVGAPDCSNGQALEGAVYVFFGTLFEVSPTPQFTFEINVAGRRLGTSVAGAGDINGDGFSDIIVGAPFTSTPEVEEGVVYICYGSPTGTTLVGLGIFQSNQAGARLGMSLAEAGDVNGDGYADIVLGAPRFTNGEATEGRVWVVLGSPAGLGTNITLETDLAGDLFGSAVAGGGDSDGDGYSDILVGAPGASPTFANEGKVQLFRGNNAVSYNRITRQYLIDLVSPLATNSADPANNLFFGIGHRARSPMQRTTAKLRWEVVHEGQPFSGLPITTSVASSASSAAWTDIGLSGFQIKALVDKVPDFYRYKWRVRVEYPMHKMIDGQRFSRWFYGFASGVGDIGVLPVHLVQFNGEVHSDGNRLMWLTATERNSAYFLVERSSDGLEFLPVGSVAAAGESAQPVAYELWDMTPPDGLSYYRLRMVDRTGHEEFSSTIPLRRDTKSLVIFPVPVEDVINWSVPLEHATHVVVRDALGRTVIDMQASSNSLQGPRVAALATGTYTIQLLDDRDHIVGRSRFVKR